MRRHSWALMLLAVTAPAFAHGMDEETQQAMLNASWWDFAVLGAEHMLTGYDHLLFLFGVLFFLSKAKDVLTFITAFTLGHCITLVGATLAGISVNYYLVDAVIALSVIYKGFENLGGFQKYLEMESPNVVGVVFGFGLIHGFGLSTRLQQLPLGENFVMNMLAFNLGVEVGQLQALLVMFVILRPWKRDSISFRRFSKISNFLLIALGSLLLLMQLHSYAHTQYPDDFGFPEHEHRHIHEHWEESHHDSL